MVRPAGGGKNQMSAQTPKNPNSNIKKNEKENGSKNNNREKLERKGKKIEDRRETESRTEVRKLKDVKNVKDVKDSESKLQGKDLSTLGKKKDAGKLYQSKDVGQHIQKKDAGKSDQLKDAGEYSQKKDVGKSDQLKDAGEYIQKKDASRKVQRKDVARKETAKKNVTLTGSSSSSSSSGEESTSEACSSDSSSSGASSAFRRKQMEAQRRLCQKHERLEEIIAMEVDVDGKSGGVAGKKRVIEEVESTDDGGDGSVGKRESGLEWKKSRREQESRMVMRNKEDREEKIVKDHRKCKTEIMKNIEDILAIMRDPENGVPLEVAQVVCEKVRGYGDTLNDILLQNIYLLGKADGQTEERSSMCEEIKKMNERMNRMTEVIDKVSKTMDRMNERMNGLRMDGEVDAGERKEIVRDRRSYAVVVKGLNEEMSSAEVGARVCENVEKNVDVRVCGVRRLKAGGLVVETASPEERQRLLEHRCLREVGLRAELPKRLDPRVVVYDVPKGVNDAQLLNGVYVKNLANVMSANDFKERVKVVRRFGKDGRECENVILELPNECKEKLMNDGRVYVGWSSYKVNVWEKVPRCFVCLNYGHKANECKSERLCWQCSESGHRAAGCRAPEGCRNCKLRGRPSGHSPISPRCPEYEWRLRVLQRKYNG